MYGKVHLRGRFNPSFAVKTHKLLLIFSDFRDFKNSPELQFQDKCPKLSVVTNFNLLFPFLEFMKCYHQILLLPFECDVI
jgi:hypothetical protein